jgi:hypothetical protein
VKAGAGPLLLLLAACGVAPRGPSVLLVTLDGVRWQEVFSGAEEGLLPGPGKEKSRYWRATPGERREALMPFLWGTVAKDGVLFGNAASGSEVRVSNAFKVSYPGYHELLCGFPHPGIKDNAPLPNPDPTVFEWLHRRPGLHGRVEAWGSWGRFKEILHPERAGFPVFHGQSAEPATRLDLLMEALPPEWKGSVFDAFVVHRAEDAVAARKPRAMYLALGDTDEWAHAGRYDRYLDSIHRADDFIGRLWNRLQGMPEYRGRTTLLVTTDHGRGTGPEGWKQHNAKHEEAGRIWVAAMGPGVGLRGEASGHPPHVQAQVAATVAAALGEDFPAAVPGAAPPIPLR